MSDDLVKVTVCEGKYTFGQRKDGSCYALRYGDPWREDIFDGLPLAMAHRIEELKAKLKSALAALGDIGNGEPEWPDDPQKELDWCRNRANEALAKIKGEQP